MSTEASVFIIESVTLEDERETRREGEILTGILQLSGKRAEYQYIRTKKELQVMLRQFADSKMRYLHISCHGNDKALFTTLDPIRFDEFGKIVRPYLNGRRLFISACEAANRKLAAEVIPESGCYSVIGPAGKIFFSDAAMVWASFYHLMFKKNPDAMKRRNIKEVLQTICDTFKVEIRYFGSSASSPYFTDATFKPNSRRVNVT